MSLAIVEWVLGLITFNVSLWGKSVELCWRRSKMSNKKLVLGLFIFLMILRMLVLF